MVGNVERFASCNFERADSFPGFLEPLEARRLMSSVLIPNYPTFKHTAGLVFNGYGTASVISNHSVQLTDGVTHEARSVWYDARVAVGAFSTSFTFISTKDPTSADGLTFDIQNVGPNALGSDGHDLGYTGITKSVGVSFNLYNYMNYGSRFGLIANGLQPASNGSFGTINLHDGDPFTCTLGYNGTTLSVRVVDDGNTADVFTASEKINITKDIGAHSAYVGFTAATGTNFSTQKIESWTYNYGPDVVSLTASPAVVTKHVSVLTANVTDPAGTAGLTYNWSVVSAPTGARTPKFSTNASTLDDTTVTIFSDGKYVFQVDVKDKSGYETTDEVDIVRT